MIRSRASSAPAVTSARTVAPPSGAVRSRYLPGLDGLRAVAVVAVLLYHADVTWLPGGFLGVDVFFVISGYLITMLLLEEHHRSGTIGVRRFYGPPGPPPPARALPAAGHHLRRRGDLLPRRGGQAAAPGPVRADLLHQLVPHRGRRLVLPAARSPLAAAPPVVARGRGAVLPAVAAGARGAAAAVPRSPRSHRPCRRRGDRRVGRVDGRAVPARAGPQPPLLRDGHPDLDDPHRRPARPLLAAVRTRPRRRPPARPAVRRDRRRRAGRRRPVLPPLHDTAGSLYRGGFVGLAALSALAVAAATHPGTHFGKALGRARSPGSACAPTRSTCGTGRSSC